MMRDKSHPKSIEITAENNRTSYRAGLIHRLKPGLGSVTRPAHAPPLDPRHPATCNRLDRAGGDGRRNFLRFFLLLT